MALKPMNPTHYPIGQQNFRMIRERGDLYVDKTGYIHELVNGPQFIFLSRPRRFGKSLLVSTLEEYFLGNRDVFEGLDIDRLEPEPWSRHPVLHIDMNAQSYQEAGNLETFLDSILGIFEETYGRRESEDTPTARFVGIIRRAYKKTGGQPVILIDEYDKPLLDVVDKPELLERNRETLRSFYGAMKSSQAYLRFAFLTGVGKIAQMNIFSGLNNIRDISMNKHYSGICGITEEEMRRYMTPGIRQMAEESGWTEEETFLRLKKNYDGYHFASDMLDVYNPFSLLNALADGVIGDYWYRTGTPTHLIKTLRNSDEVLTDLDGIDVSESVLADGDITGSDPVTILYYTGYLTLKKWDREDRSYILGYPNGEVTRGFLTNLLAVISHMKDNRSATDTVRKMSRLIRERKLDEFFEILKSFYAGFPYEIERANEFHYQDVLYCVCKLLGYYVQAEFHTSQGRIDMILGTENTIYIMEFKLDGTAEQALQQIKDKNYCLPFKIDGRQLILAGINFSSKTRTIDSWVAEKA